VDQKFSLWTDFSKFPCLIISQPSKPKIFHRTKQKTLQEKVSRTE
jgi:hypothetical protein